MRTLSITGLMIVAVASVCASGKTHTAPQKAGQRSVSSARLSVPTITSKLSIEGRVGDFDVKSMAGKGYLSLDDVAVLLGGKIVAAPGGFVLSMPTAIAKDSDIELHGTYTVRKDTFSGLPTCIVYIGTLTNTGSVVAPLVKVTCIVKGFPVSPKPPKPEHNDDYIKENEGVWANLHLDSFKNLRPGETRNVSAIATFSDKDLMGVPSDGEVITDVPPEFVSFSASVSPLKSD